MRRAAISVLAAFAIGLLLLQPGIGAAPFSLFGAATLVKTGAPPNPWAVQLISNTGNGTSADDFGGIAFQDSSDSLTFAGLYGLSADYQVVTGDCGGGAPRFSIGIDTNDDGAVDGNVFVYIGPEPSFSGCAALLSEWQSTGNLIGIPAADKRYDLTQVGGTFYDTYDNALTLVGSKKVLYVALVVDAGWAFPLGYVQTFNVDKFAVNNHTVVARGFGR